MEQWILSKKWYHRLTQHLLFWGGHLLVFTLLSGGETFWNILLHALINLIPQMTSVYLMIYLIFPRLLIPKKYLLFFVIALLSLTIISLGQYGLSALTFPAMRQEGFVLRFWLSNFVILGYTTALALGIKLLKYWNQRERYIKELDNARLETELKFLKAQIHPHFLFNTMNNLYTLSLKRSKKAPEIVEKLSDLLRYMAYEVSHPLVALENEIEQLKNYMALEKLRYGPNLELSFSINGNVEEVKIAPLLLLPFVENSFKHGVSGKMGASWITISLEIEKEVLQFKVENSKSSQIKDETGYTQGIGLKNVKRRLELIYTDKYDLKIIDTETHLIVLKIDLS